MRGFPLWPISCSHAWLALSTNRAWKNASEFESGLPKYDFRLLRLFEWWHQHDVSSTVGDVAMHGGSDMEMVSWQCGGRRLTQADDVVGWRHWDVTSWWGRAIDVTQGGGLVVSGRLPLHWSSFGGRGFATPGRATRGGSTAGKLPNSRMLTLGMLACERTRTS